MLGCLEDSRFGANPVHLRAVWAGTAAQLGGGELPGVGVEDRREEGVKHLEETDARSSVSNLLQWIWSMDPKHPPPISPHPPTPGPQGSAAGVCCRGLLHRHAVVLQKAGGVLPGNH